MVKGFTGSLKAMVEAAAGPRPALQSVERMAEARLIAAARRGERKALNQLLQQASEPAYRFSRSFCRDPHEAEDLAQDVMATLLRTLRTFRGDSSLSTWTYTVARRACARRKKRHARQQPLDPTSLEKLAAPASEAGPHQRLERRQLGQALERAIASLPADQREVIVLRDVEGLPAAEVAKIVGIGERAVKSRLHRARLVLREKLAPYVTGRDAPPRGAKCPDTARLLSRWVEGELSPEVCERMEKHVSTCAACGDTCESLRAVLGACRAYGAKPLPESVGTAVRVAVRGVLAGY
jgi:RNA polymerase sigma-70 factor (ECF subfamily)